MKKLSIFLLCLFFSVVLQAGNFDWYRLVQFSQRSHFANGISTDANRNVNVTGSYYPCLVCNAVGFVASYDSLSAPRWSVVASTFGIINIEFSRPFNDNDGNIYTSIYIPQGALSGPQLSVNSVWIGGPDTSGYVVIFRFSTLGNLDWYRVIPTSNPVVHYADEPGNTYFSNGDTTWKYSPGGILSWRNTGKGGSFLSVGGSDVYVGNGTTVDRLSAATGIFKSTWTLPTYSDIEAGSGGVIFGTGNQGTFKVQNGAVIYQNAGVKGTGISKRSSDMWVVENFPALSGLAGTMTLKRLSASNGAVLETQNINDVEPSGSRGNIAIDASGSVHVSFRGYDGAAYSYLKLFPFVVWRDYQNYESLFLAKFRTKFLSPVLGFTNSVWTNGEFGVDKWNESDIGAKKPCSGVNGFNVGYSLRNTTFLTGNSVNVEISDSVGDFTNPTVIGTKQTTLATDSVYCDIPFNLPNGPNYRLRLRTTNPALYSIQEGNPVGIYAPKSTLSSNGPLSFCKNSQGAEIICVNDKASNTILWERNGIINGDLIGANILPVKSGIYNALVADVDGCARRSDNIIPITVWPIPKAQLNLVGSNIICKDSSLQLQVNAPTAVSYQWLRNNIPLSGVNDSGYTTGLGGTYKVQVTDVNGCTKTSLNAKVIVYRAEINAESSLSFCVGDSVILIGPVTNTTAYQWRKNGIEIPGANSINYTAKDPGSYTVVTTGTTGCTALSPAKIVTVNCREGNVNARAWNVYPNPAADLLFVEWGTSSGNGILELTDISGRVLHTESCSSTIPLLSINLKSFTSGLYMVRFIGDDGYSETRKIVKN
jgi:hypothetical protein